MNVLTLIFFAICVCLGIYVIAALAHAIKLSVDDIAEKELEAYYMRPVKFVRIPANLLMRIYELTMDYKSKWPVSYGYLVTNVDNDIVINSEMLHGLKTALLDYEEPDVALYISNEIDRLLGDESCQAEVLH